MYNASERKDVKRAEKAARIADRARRDVIKSLMAGTAGRSYVLETLERCHVFASSFATNALSMAFAEGERNQGLQLLNDIMRACPEAYVLMMQERNERDLANDRASDRNADDSAASEPADSADLREWITNGVPAD